LNNSSIFLTGGKGRDKINEFPEFVYFDTSYWNQAIGISNSTYRRECVNFIEECLNNKSIICTSNLVLGEMDHVVGNAFTMNYAKNNNFSIPKFSNGKYNMKALHQNIIDSDREFTRKYEEQLSCVRDTIKKVSVNLDYLANEEFNDLAFKIRKSTNFILGDKDSQHAAICYKNEINNIATVDGDFWSLDNFNVFTVPNNDFKIKSIDRANVYLKFDKNKY